MLQEKVANFIKEKGFNLDAMAGALNVSKAEILTNLPSDIGIATSGDKFDEVIGDIQKWGEVLVVKVTPSFIMEIKTEISEGKYARGYYNLSTANAPLGGHLKADDIEHIVFLSTVMVMGMLSHAVCFFDKNGDEIFKIYVARDEKRNFIKEQEEAFKALRAKYA